MPLFPSQKMREVAIQDVLCPIPPSGGEHKSTNNDSKITYNFTPVKRWPESGTDSAKTGQNQVKSMPAGLAEIIRVWSKLPKHIKQAIMALIKTA